MYPESPKYNYRFPVTCVQITDYMFTSPFECGFAYIINNITSSSTAPGLWLAAVTKGPHFLPAQFSVYKPEPPKFSTAKSCAI